MSNVYPLWWDTTITIFNKFEDTETHVVKWFKTIIPNCFWKHVGDTMSVGTTIVETDKTVCRIPQNDRYLPPMEFYTTPSEEMSEHFTLSQGDLIFCGEITDEIDEYKKGQRSTDIVNKYKKAQGVLEIKSVTINTSKGILTPHYHVNGV